MGKQVKSHTNNRSIVPATRVLVADDHPVVLHGVAAMIGSIPDMAVVGKAHNGREAVELYLSLKPDIALLDLRMPELDGVGAVREIRAAIPSARIIILTTYENDDDIQRALEMGAQAYILKDATLEELTACIKAVLAGRKYVAASVAARLAERVTRVQLSVRELEVLRLLSAGKANKEIASELSISESTVKLHVTNVFAKLEVSNRTEAMRAALQRGLIRMPE